MESVLDIALKWENPLFTRGNGRKGQDILHAIKYLDLPDKPNLEIRGELLMRNKYLI